MKNLPDLFSRRQLSSGNPYRNISDFQRQMDRFFDEVWSGVVPTALGTATGGRFDFSPSCDIEETGDHYLMSFDLPGVKKEDIRIELNEGLLTVSGERKEEREEKGKNRYQSERAYGVFQRSFQLPQGAKAEDVEASYSDGVLRIAVPKTEASQPKQIQIGEGKPGIWDRIRGLTKEDQSKTQESEQKQGQKSGGQRTA